MKNERVLRMKNIIDTHCYLNRSPVSEGNNQLVNHLCERFGTKPLSIPSSSECLTWLIPKAWKVKKAYLAKTDGTIIADFKDNPLYLWAHSIAFKGEISREDLEAHLSFNKEQPDWIFYHYRNEYKFDARDWGFSLPYNKYLELTDNTYYVEIDSSLDDSLNMDIANIYVKGESESCIIFSAHTCHPAMVTDGLSNIAVLCEVIELLNKMGKTKYSYRFIFGPEYYAAAGYLANAEDQETKNIKGGAYLDMLGNHEHIGWQSSYYPSSYMDRATKNIFTYHVPNSFNRPYRKLWGNDEMFYNGPSYHIPMVGIAGDKFEKYHFDQDNTEFVDYGQLDFSVDMMMKLIDLFEKDCFPSLKYKGPLYQSRYNLYIDPKINPEGYARIEEIQILADGTRTLFDIADKLDIDFSFVYEFFEKLKKENLVEFKPFVL